MKIAIPTRDGRIDDHFGHCDHYTIYTVADKTILHTETLASPEGCGCKSGIAADLEAMGVEVMLAGNMGEGAKNKLQSHHIRVIRGCKGDVEAVLQGFLSGFILDSGEVCDHHECLGHTH